MKDIGPFIDLGWHTVPLGGSLQRLDGGKKTLPEFEKDWRAKYQNELNTTKSRLGGVITGECSGICAIDCDNADTWNLFLSLAPNYKFVFISKGKGYDAGTFIFEYDKDLAESFGINDGVMALDFYANRGFVYLPTVSNRTKVPLTELPPIEPVPPLIKVLLQQLAKKNAVQSEAKTVNPNVLTASCLAPLVEQFCVDGKFMPGLFRIITPKSFRSEIEYVEHAFLHPNSVPQGRGSEYLSKISAILGADISIGQDLYNNAMHKINDLFSSPMKTTQLEKTIMDPMLRGTANVDGKTIWSYDEDWKRHRLMLQSKRQCNLELCFDDRRNMYYVVDTINESIRGFNRDSELMAYIEAAAVQTPKKFEVKQSLPIAEVKAVPNLPFGFNEGPDPTARLLNTFVQTPELAIFNNPDSYVAKYKYPTCTLQYLETLVPEEKMRNYLIRFIRTKLQTFGYSPVVLYFLGAHGSGKDIFVGLLEQIMGNIARPTTKEFLEMFNGWLLDNYFVQLDEYGNQLTSTREREEALGKIKAYTGKQNIQIRQMRTDGFMYHHNATFIMTANKNPLMVEEGDRRVCFLATPNVLADQPWVLERGGMSEVYNSIQSELKDFCYYLAKEVQSLSPTEYMKPPESIDKMKLIADSMYAAQRIAFVLKNGMRDYFVELCYDYNQEDAANAAKHNQLTTIELTELYDEMTDMKGDSRTLFKLLRNSGVHLTATTKSGQKCFKVRVNTSESPFEADE